MKSIYHIDPLPKTIAKELVITYHYSHAWSSCRYALGLFGGDTVDGDLPHTLQGTPVGVAVYGFPVGRQTVQSISPVLQNNEVLELTRLWVHDNEPINTESFFLGRTFQWLRENTAIRVLVAYSDPMYGHLGIIYQATNWVYQGNHTMLIPGFLHKVHGKVLHPRTCVAKYGTVKEDVLLKEDNGYERVPMLNKHRYIYILRREDRKALLNTLKHPALPYPKGNNGGNYDEVHT